MKIKDSFYSIVFVIAVAVILSFTCISLYISFKETIECVKKGGQRVKTTYSYVCAVVITPQDIEELIKSNKKEDSANKARKPSREL